MREGREHGNQSTRGRTAYGDECSCYPCGGQYRGLLYHQVFCQTHGAAAELGDAIRVRFEASRS